MVAGFDSRWVFTGVVLLVVVQRLVELRLSRHNEKRLLRRGAFEVGAGHYPWMVALHTAFLIAAPLEVWFLDRVLHPWLGLTMAFVLVAATGLRYWTTRTLDERWTTRVICLPGGAVETGGPYRFVRHPNYLAVMLETIALPLLHTAWLTALLFGVSNAVLLSVRIGVEEGALAAHSGYREAFGSSFAQPRARPSASDPVEGRSIEGESKGPAP